MNHLNQLTAGTLETPKSAMKSTTKCSESKCSGTDTVEQMNIGSEHSELIDKNDRKESNPRIKFVQHDDNGDDEQSYHHQTPISCKMNKFMMCFKSEPDLSRVQNLNENVPMLHRGRFIAKKLLSGVSMINLRRPFTNGNGNGSGHGNEKATNAITESSASKMENSAQDTIPLPKCVTNVCSTVVARQPAAIETDDKIDDDDEDFVDDEEVDREYDDSVDKENQIPFRTTTTIDYMVKLKQQQHQQQQSVLSIGCNSIALSDSIGNDSVSPITKSTHRMSKAMQVIEK